jgi:hypothetical protein
MYVYYSFIKHLLCSVSELFVGTQMVSLSLYELSQTISTGGLSQYYRLSAWSSTPTYRMSVYWAVQVTTLLID